MAPWAAWLVVGGAAFVHGLAGFGSALFAMPLLALYLDLRTVSPAVALMGLTLNLVLLWQLRGRVAWRHLPPVLAGALAGVPVGVGILREWPVAWLKAVLGVVLVAYGAWRLRRRPTPGAGDRPWPAALLGFAAGCLGGAFNTSGPPVILWAGRQPWPKDTVKATLQAFFLVLSAGVVAGHAWAGLIDARVTAFYLSTLPALLAGLALGAFLYRRVTTEGYRDLLHLALVGLGLLSLWSARGG
ncbi:sulfite exporter TauE/SafE family protein [Dissulfurirhabdus thermomarina]|uniref:Probable membrane transporter protein n=1 Tax=Dissulfurirhabdus thermomarina TaxID=1765737 RepID=A0A6N9TT40_DISTH|nr:sulfite exporter TauE/SafE family protein [Dissulfurirhabdus thermomarina]NDY43253.1 sulfite exporter TauE/SafE family protein [Dissulfurirhabdus thermomarina]NMX23128.1 sulfite exporter TauE/SafE family protein [Dissulfurirhabdus thermomarina]